MLRQSPNYAKYLELCGWQVEKLNCGYIYIKKIFFLKFIKIQRVSNFTKKDFDYLIKKYHPFQIIVEPIKPINLKGFKQSNEPYLPTKTLQIDISKSESEIVKSFKTDVRRSINKTYQVNSNVAIQQFSNDWKHAVPFLRYVPSTYNLLNLKKTFGKKSLFISGNHCGVIYLIAGKTLFYYQAWSNKKYTNVRDMYKLVWEGIKWGKKNGCNLFDFDGIYDERFPNKSWAGFTNFKKRFGGTEICYPHCLIWKKFNL